jgi:hypothetical protein
MYLTKALTLGAVGASLVVGLFAVPAGAAQAAIVDGVAAVGSANVMIAGHVNTLGDVAQCRVGSISDNSTPGSSIAGVVSFGPGRSSCTRSYVTGATTATAIGTRFQLDALRSFGGPRIRLGYFRVTCRADRFGAGVDSTFSGLTGLGNLPRNIPDDYTVEITGSGGRVVAVVVLNEVQPSRFHGGVALNVLHIKLFPGGGLFSGDVVVGHSACARTY